MPAHDEALNERSLMPPPGAAGLWLLPHAAMTKVADTASAAVAHALCFTLTSTGPARRGAWPGIRPGLSRRLFLVVPAVKGTRGYLACSLPNRNPILMASLAYPTYAPGLHRRSWCLPPTQPASQPAGSRG